MQTRSVLDFYDSINIIEFFCQRACSNLSFFYGENYVAFEKKKYTLSKLNFVTVRVGE